MRKILLLGANGFLGRALKEALIKQDYLVYTASRSGGDIDCLIDIGKWEQWSRLDFIPDVVINCATVLPGGNYLDQAYVESVMNTNFWGTINLCKWIKANNSVKFVLNISSLSVVNKAWPVPLMEDAPTYPLGAHVVYGSSKLNQELLLSTFGNDFGVGICNARLSALYGEKMAWTGVLCNYIDKALNQQSIQITNGNKVGADFLYIKNACGLLIGLLKNNVSGIVNVASGEEITLHELAKKIVAVVGSGSIVTNKDIANTESRAVIDIGKLLAHTMLDENISFEQGIRNTISYRKLMIDNLI